MDQNEVFELILRLDEKIDKLAVAQSKSEAADENIMQTLVAIKSDLAYHIRRTDELESQVTKVKGFLFYFSVSLATLATASTVAYNIWRFFH